MNWKSLAIAAALMAAGALVLTQLPPADAAGEVVAATAAQAAPANADVVARGAYLVKIMGCNDCHTPWTMTDQGPGPDMSRMLSGHPQDFAVTPPDLGAGPWVWAATGTNTAFAGPWGVSFTANLTPDPETGLGKWTADTFVDAIRNGRHEGQGRPLLPPMPWPMYRNATDDDLRAVFAYLHSIEPIRNKVPQPIEPAEAH